MQLLFSNNNQYNVRKSNHLHFNCSLPSHTFHMRNFSNIWMNQFTIDNHRSLSLKTYDSFEGKMVEYNSSNSCFESATAPGESAQLSLVSCSLNVEHACNIEMCVPFCCGNIDEHEQSLNGTKTPTCLDRTDKITLRSLFRKSSNASLRYYQQDLKDTCSMGKHEEFAYTDIAPDDPNNFYQKTSSGYRLRLNNVLLKPSEYCITKYNKKTIRNDNQLHKRSFQVKMCKNKRWLQIYHEVIGSALCCISILCITIDIALQLKNWRHYFQIRTSTGHQPSILKQPVLSDALRTCTLLCMLLYFIVIALKPIYPYIFSNHAPLCTCIGLAAQFLYLSIMSWTVALSRSTCAPLFNFKASVMERNRENINRQTGTIGFYDTRFKWYFLFSTSVPLTWTSLTSMMMHLPNNIEPHWIKPTIGLKTCTFSGNYDFAIYLVIPSGMLLLVALAFWVRFSFSYCAGAWNQSKCIDRIRKELDRNESVRTRNPTDGNEMTVANESGPQSESNRLNNTATRFNTEFDEKGGVRQVNMVNKFSIPAKEFGILGAFWLVDSISSLIRIQFGIQHTVTLSFNLFFDTFSYLNGLWFLLLSNHKQIFRSQEIGRLTTQGAIELRTVE